jgi:hypothetical protein
MKKKELQNKGSQNMFLIFCVTVTVSALPALCLDLKGTTIKGMTTGYFSIVTTCVKETMESCRQSEDKGTELKSRYIGG